jgi:hydroxylamine reductase (hybrid-cluster protein)
VDKTMANRNLLKEAIADAKSVKEAAIANAKAALEEAFTPYLKEKFSAKLAEMEEEDMYEADKEMDETYSEEGMEEMSNPVEEKRTEKMREKPEVEEMDLDELLAELD